jgi:hypothetical protein
MFQLPSSIVQQPFQWAEMMKLCEARVMGMKLLPVWYGPPSSNFWILIIPEPGRPTQRCQSSNLQILTSA